jgi:hypothetical protein
MKRLWLIQAAGNALLFWCAFNWLGLRDARASQLAETAVFGLLILILWLWLQDGTFAYCADRSLGLWGAFRRGGKTLAVFSAVVIVFALIFWLLGMLQGPLTTAGERTASWLTFHLRKPIKPITWVKTYLAMLWVVRWIVLPIAVLPIVAGAARNGARGMWRKSSKVFGLQYLAALLIGFYLPSVLMSWVPKLTDTTAQVLSFAVRFGLAYVLIISAWLAVAFFSAYERAKRPDDLPAHVASVES